MNFFWQSGIKPLFQYGASVLCPLYSDPSCCPSPYVMNCYKSPCLALST